MNVLIASDKFKGSLTAAEACAAIRLGLENSESDTEFEISEIPIADGGEGMARASPGQKAASGLRSKPKTRWAVRCGPDTAGRHRSRGRSSKWRKLPDSGGWRKVSSIPGELQLAEPAS